MLNLKAAISCRKRPHYAIAALAIEITGWQGHKVSLRTLGNVVDCGSGNSKFFTVVPPL